MPALQPGLPLSETSQSGPPQSGTHQSGTHQSGTQQSDPHHPGALPPAGEQPQLSRTALLAAYQILDTPSEPLYEQVVQLACGNCATPAGMLALLDEGRFWFKARHGIAQAEAPLPAATSFPLNAALPALIVEADLWAPAATASSQPTPHGLPLPAIPGMRFFAGVPVLSAEGLMLGLLCVVSPDARPEGLNAAQAANLRLLGEHTATLLMRRRNARRSGAEDIEASGAAVSGFPLAAAQEVGGIGIFELDLHTQRCLVSPQLCTILGLPVRPEYPLLDLISVRTAADGPQEMPLFATGDAPRNTDQRIRRPSDGEIRWVRRRGEYRRDAQGHPAKLIGIVQDITDQQNALARKEALMRLGDDMTEAHSEAEAIAMASRLLGETLGAARAGYCKVDLESRLMQVESDWHIGGMSTANGHYPAAQFTHTLQWMAQNRPLVVNDITAPPWHGRDLDGYRSIEAVALLGTPVFENGTLTGCFFAHMPRPRIWAEEDVVFMQAVGDRAHATITKMRAQADQRLLHHEMGHRLKNSLAMVLAIARQTLRDQTSPETLQTFLARIQALSSAHDVLLQQHWVAARLRGIVDGLLQRHGMPERFEVSGPNLTLSPSTALTFSMLLHELLTNAVKYGALSTPEGRVLLHWHTALGKDGPMVHLRWQEHGGPPVKPPERQGFGTQLIQRGMAGKGQVTLEFLESGLVASFHVPLAAEPGPAPQGLAAGLPKRQSSENRMALAAARPVAATTASPLPPASPPHSAPLRRNAP